jgi:LPXTG-motif cell wall-anchored protein
MGGLKMLGLILLVAGGLALAYGGFSYTKETHQIDMGPLSMQVAEKQRVNVPIWAGIGALLIGGLLLVVKRKK